MTEEERYWRGKIAEEFERATRRRAVVIAAAVRAAQAPGWPNPVGLILTTIATEIRRGDS